MEEVGACRGIVDSKRPAHRCWWAREVAVDEIACAAVRRRVWSRRIAIGVGRGLEGPRGKRENEVPVEAASNTGSYYIITVVRCSVVACARALRRDCGWRSVC